MKEYQWQRLLNMNPVPKLTVDIKRFWAMELTRNYIK
jgi:hypothetical protein